MNTSITEKMQDSNITQKEIGFKLFMPIAKLSENSTIFKEFTKSGNKKIIETDFGKVEIRNRLLTEYHQKIIASIIKMGELTVLPDGAVAVRFKELDVLRDLKMGEKNYTRLREAIKSISDTQYYITFKGLSRNLRIFRDHLVGEGSKIIQGVVFDPLYVEMHKNDFSISYKSLYNKMQNIPFPTIPSIVKRLMFKNRFGKREVYKLDDILMEIGFPVDSTGAKRNILSSMKKYQQELYDDFNIIYDITKKTLSYEKIEEIAYIEPLIESDEELNSYITKTIIHENKDFLITDIQPLNKDKNEWQIMSEESEITLHCYLDELLFYLSSSKKSEKSEKKLIDNW